MHAHCLMNAHRLVCVCVRMFNNRSESTDSHSRTGMDTHIHRSHAGTVPGIVKALALNHLEPLNPKPSNPKP